MAWWNDAWDGISGFAIGAYDFVSDRIDDVTTVIGDTNDWARDNIPCVSDVEDFVHGFYTTAMTEVPGIDLLKKEIDKRLLKTLYVPAKKRHTDRIIEDFDQQVETIGEDAKQTISSIADQLDEEIKGQFSTAALEAVESKNEQWDQLV